MTAPATTTLSTADSAAPVEYHYFEEYAPGSVCVHGSITMTEGCGRSAWATACACAGPTGRPAS
ncbi:hypothetical protein FE633_29555 [Streptomyces montanus]|uniref:Uncharacterized protein n=1 Tax=Streptomyces montanus TaxID=2580423 RepID=A0A5R9FFT5_9ACTN|nr:hypothetical protein [Streptomyces montanus]TLS42637.1 hypothetical protein FE633_29555 [Streptomyces montanus]